MELVQQIGQLFILGFRGSSLPSDHPLAADLQERNLGGVILFDRLLARGGEPNNIIDPEQVRALTETLREYGSQRLLIAVDQEGGMVRRLKPQAGFPATASAAELGRKDDATLTRIHGACTAVTLAELGINFNLAPVLDLNVYPDNPVIGRLERSFSAEPATVIRQGSCWVQSHRQHHILSCLKHFPGHGSSRADSHLGFTDISDSWQENELQPFAALIREGLADSVMLGHLFHKGLDPEYPASLSPAVVTTLLRQRLGYTGVVLTDDLQMKAITDKYGLEEAACQAIRAGVDMMIIGNNLDHEPEILQRLIRAVIRGIEQGTINEGLIHSAYERITSLKEGLL